MVDVLDHIHSYRDTAGPDYGSSAICIGREEASNWRDSDAKSRRGTGADFDDRGDKRAHCRKRCGRLGHVGDRTGKIRCLAPSRRQEQERQTETGNEQSGAAGRDSVYDWVAPGSGGADAVSR
jgi:hypothetical protein